MNEPTPNPPRLADSPSPTGRVLDDARAQTAQPEPGQRERVWRQLHAPQRTVRWLVPVALATAAAAGLVLWLAPPRATPATIALTAGAAELKTEAGWTAMRVGTRLDGRAELRTGTSGRVGLRVAQGAALVLEQSQASLTLHRAETELQLMEGMVVSAAPSLRVVADTLAIEGAGASTFIVQVAAARTEVAVFVVEGTAHVRTASGTIDVPAGASWSNRGHATAPPAGVAAAPLVRSLGTGAEKEAPLEVRGNAGTPVSIDGLAVGEAPVTVLAPVGAHRVTAAYDGEPISVVTRPEDSRVVLPPAQPAVGARAEGQTMAELQARLAAATPGERDALTYELARHLTAADRHADAVALYETLARGDGARADASLYEVGRLRLRFLGQADRALDAFAEHQRRFPSSALAPDVALSALEAHLQLGHLRPALDAMDAFVTRFPRSERLADVHFLQAQVHQELGHCERALPLFLTLLDGAHADDALYFAAFCEQRLAKPAAAQAHLRAYLERFPQGRHAADARSALGP